MSSSGGGPPQWFEFDDIVGAVASWAVCGALDAGFERALRRLLDPAGSRRSVHWGRSYLYEARWPLGLEGRETHVVVKQFRHDDLQARLRRRRRGSRARLSFEAARRFRRFGIPTPELLLFAESRAVDGPAWFVCRVVPDALELRYVLRAVNADECRERFPEIDGDEILRRVGALAADLHRHGVWFRDLTSGNVLLSAPRDDADLFLVDLNRARFRRRLTASQRLRDLSRMPVLRYSDRSEYLGGYRSGGLSRFQRLWFEACHHGFRLKIQSKTGVRSGFRRLADLVLPRRRAHPHVPAAKSGAPARERTVWDPLTDQPHQQATRGQRLAVRLRDFGSHAGPLLRSAVPLAASIAEAKRIRRRLDRESVAVPAGVVGVAVGPGSAPPAALARSIDDLGVDAVLLRFHLWRGVDPGLVELARSLTCRDRPIDLVFQLCQDRSLVRDGILWRRRVGEAAALLAPFGDRFLIGQAPNRSKWGVWRPEDHGKLLAAGADAVRSQCPDARLLAPAVIDFEPHATAALIFSGLASRRFDVLASQLYVDRRGAPENRQLGFDLAGKLALLRSLARRSPDCASAESWITEFNWPLREGPHSPAGRDVAVDEESQASYLVRYVLEALGTGLVERVYWWQLVAAGYGLLDPRGGALRQRPAFRALRHLHRQITGSRLERLVLPAGVRGYRVRREGRESLVLWSLDRRGQSYRPPVEAVSIRDRDGVELDSLPRRLGPAPVWIEVRAEAAGT